MRTIAIGTVAIALLASACASPASLDVDSVQGVASAVPTSSVTTSPVASAPETTFPVTKSPITIPEVATSGESDAPSGNEDSETEPTGQEPTVTTQPPKENRVKPILPVEPVAPNPSGPVAAAIADLATRLGIDESGVTLVSQEEVTWPDSSLGCPEPGMEYTQALVSGSLLVFDVGGRLYEYHSGGGGDPFYCAVPTPPTPGEHGDT